VHFVNCSNTFFMLV